MQNTFFLVIVVLLNWISIIHVSGQNLPIDTLSIDIVFEKDKTEYIFDVSNRNLPPGNYIASVPYLYNSKLKRYIPKLTITPNKITIKKDTTFPIVQLGVSGVPKAGRYEGPIIFNKTSDTLIYWLNLIFRSQEDLTITISNSTINTVRGANWINNILPVVQNNNAVSFLFTYTGDDTLKIDNQSFNLQGEKSQLETKQTFATLNESKIPNNGLPKNISFSIDPTELKADSYKGTLFVRDHASIPYKKVDFTLNVRNGAGSALIALFLGFIFGIIARKVETNQALLDLYNTFQGIREQAKKIADEDLRNYMTTKIRHLEHKFDTIQNDELLSSLTTEIQNLTVQVSYAQDFNFYYFEAKNLGKDTDTAFLAAREKLISQIKQPIPDKAVIIQIGLEINDVLYGKTELISERNLRYQPFNYSLIENSPTETQIDTNQNISNRFRNLIFQLTGFSLTRKIYVPIVYLVSIALALLAAFYDSYIIKGVTFGSDGFYDYLKLFIYGTGIVIVIDQFFKTMMPTIRTNLGI